MEMKAEDRNPCPVHRNKTKRLIMGFVSRFQFFMYLTILLIHIMHPGKLDAAEIMFFPQLEGNVSVLTDKSFALTLSDILSSDYQKEFQSSSVTSLNYAFSKTAIWVKLSIPSGMNGHGVL